MNLSRLFSEEELVGQPEGRPYVALPSHSYWIPMQARINSFLSVTLVTLIAFTVAGCGPNLFDRIGNFWSLGCCGAIIVILDIIALIELAGSPRSVGNKLLWAAIIIFMPLLGCILYYFFAR